MPRAKKVGAAKAKLVALTSSYESERLRPE
jgi:hypothetical protein